MVTVLLLLALLMALLASHFMLTIIDLGATDASMRTIRGLYAAEAGLNVRVQVVRSILDANSLPTGTAPNTGPGQTPCDGGNNGSGDLACIDYSLQKRDVSTYVEEVAANPVALVIPRGERFQNVKADEYRYLVGAIAKDIDNRREAKLEMSIESRSVPVFQFAAFYDKDLEISPGSTTALSGPIHSNGDLYLDPGADLDINGQVTSAGNVYRGSKHQDACAGTNLRVIDPDSLAALPVCTGNRAQLSAMDLAPWNGMIRASTASVTVPTTAAFDPTPGATYWDQADFRVMLDLPAGPAVEVRAADGSVDGASSAVLGGCAAATYSNLLYNWREAAFIEMLDVDLDALLDCLHQNALMGGGKDLDDTSDGGLVFYFGVDGPNSSVVNNYGVRLLDGDELASTLVTAPAIRGLTIVTDQALYVQGNYNSINKQPAALVADSFNVLSNSWNDGNSSLALGSRLATSTTIQAAVLSGTDTTGGIEGTGGQDLGAYNGGLDNQVRLLESWTTQTLTFRGSLVSLDSPQHVSSAWSYGAPFFEAPVRDWDYETDFDDPADLPPLAPRFIYIRQELRLQRFEL